MDVKFEMILERDRIRKWLSETDYMVHKFVLGEITAGDEKWLEYLETRKEKVARLNFIVAELSKPKGGRSDAE
jgi:hypothetical protein